MKNIIVLIILVFSVSIFANAQFLPELEKIKEIKLLESNRDDVRRIFKDYKQEKDFITDYDEWFFTDSARIEVSYSAGNCSRSNFHSWNVPEWKVIEIAIFPETKIKTKDLGFDLSKYKVEKVFDVADAAIYTNNDKEIKLSKQLDEVNEIDFFPSKKFKKLSCDKENSNLFHPIGNWFKGIFGKNRMRGDANLPADVEKLNLSLSEITANCSLSDSAKNKSCSDGIKLISVVTVVKDPENNVVTHVYKVSGGKIIGQGAKVIWDLSEVKLGKYTIMAAVDDGCGFCGKSMTKTVVVKECPNCGEN